MGFAIQKTISLMENIKVYSVLRYGLKIIGVTAYLVKVTSFCEGGNYFGLDFSTNSAPEEYAGLSPHRYSNLSDASLWGLDIVCKPGTHSQESFTMGKSEFLGMLEETQNETLAVKKGSDGQGGDVPYVSLRMDVKGKAVYTLPSDGIVSIEMCPRELKKTFFMRVPEKVNDQIGHIHFTSPWQRTGNTNQICQTESMLVFPHDYTQPCHIILDTNFLDKNKGLNIKATNVREIRMYPDLKTL